MTLIRWPHTVERAVTNDTAVGQFAGTIAQRTIFPRASESAHWDSVPATKTLKMALPVISYAGFGIVDGIKGLFKGGRRIDWIRVEDRSVENVI